MIKNYFKIAWRSLLKNKAMFSINVIGLAIGISTCLIITLFVVDELSYDRHFEKVNQTVRVILHAKMGNELIDEASVMAPVASALQAEIPEIQKTTRIYHLTNATKATYKGKTIRRGDMAFADSTFFDVFSLQLLRGNPKMVLQKPYSVVLTSEQAKTYFGNADPINQTIEIKDIGIHGQNGYQSFAGLYTVTGIMEEIPENTHFKHDILASMNTNTLANNDSWLSGQYHTYLTLADGTDLDKLENKIKTISNRYFSPQLKASMGLNLEEFTAKGNEVGLYVMPLADIHLYSKLRGELRPSGDIKTVWIFGAVAIFMLIIACINFINLSTASASKRLKEVGVRKVLGSEKSQLVFQFLSEAFISTLCSMLFGLAIFALALPLFNQLSGKNILFNGLLNPLYISSIGLMVIVISILAGTYPAFFLSGFKPILALKNRFTSSGSKGLRSGLVVFQFTISAMLIIGTIVVNQQMTYILNKDIGYDRTSLIVLRDAGYLGNNLQTFKDDLKKDSRVKNITISAFIPAGPSDNYQTAIGKFDDPEQRLRSSVYQIDEEYISTLGMKLVAGRNFSKAFGEEPNKILINETAIKAFGLPENPIGLSIKELGNEQEAQPMLEVVGVVKDFHTRSLHEPILPLIMKYRPYYGIILKTEEKDIPGLLSQMETKWNSFGTGEPFHYAFLDELYNETYLKEANQNTILRAFALLTIFVACLGLFGLITFTTEQRFKEIGIRKTLGSSVPQIVGLLSKDFLKLIAISLLIAFPLGYYVMNNWLQDFEYRINIDWWIFLLAGLATFLIAFLTISFRSIKAALMDPVKSLKSE